MASADLRGFALGLGGGAAQSTADSHTRGGGKLSRAACSLRDYLSLGQAISPARDAGGRSRQDNQLAPLHTVDRGDVQRRVAGLAQSSLRARRPSWRNAAGSLYLCP